MVGLSSGWLAVPWRLFSWLEYASVRLSGVWASEERGLILLGKCLIRPTKMEEKKNIYNTVFEKDHRFKQTWFSLSIWCLKIFLKGFEAYKNVTAPIWSCARSYFNEQEHRRILVDRDKPCRHAGNWLNRSIPNSILTLPNILDF